MMPCVTCGEVVVGTLCATVHATDDYLRWATSHCARTPAPAESDLPRLPCARGLVEGVTRRCYKYAKNMI